MLASLPQNPIVIKELSWQVSCAVREPDKKFAPSQPDQKYSIECDRANRNRKTTTTKVA